MAPSPSPSRSPLDLIEEGKPAEAQDLPQSHPEKSGSSAVNNRQSRLSAVSRMYDINGDGELDEAEKAMRAMDASGKGYLSNDKVYNLMTEHMETQKELFRTKKWVIGLVIVTILLTLSNLGTSFAAAILSKETTTNSKNELVTSDSHEVVATQTAADNIEVARVYVEIPEGQETEDRDRKLRCATNKQGQTQCSTDSYVSISSSDAQQIITKCSNDKTVNIIRTFDDTTRIKTNICPAFRTVHANEGTLSESFTLYYDKARTQAVTISANGDRAGTFSISGDPFLQDENEICDDNNDCDSGLECSASKVCVKESATTENPTLMPTSTPTSSPTSSPTLSPIVYQAGLMDSCLSDDECVFDLLCYDNDSCGTGNRCGVCGCDTNTCPSGEECVFANDDSFPSLKLCTCPEEWVENASYSLNQYVSVGSTMYMCLDEESCPSSNPEYEAWGVFWTEVGPCVQLLGEGDDCGESHTDCDEGLTCSSTSSICVIEQGGACINEDSVCYDGYTCDYLDTKLCVEEGDKTTTCPGEFDESAVYGYGDMVSSVTDAYECTVADCSSGILPEIDSSSWSLLGSCIIVEGSLAGQLCTSFITCETGLDCYDFDALVQSGTCGCNDMTVCPGATECVAAGDDTHPNLKLCECPSASEYVADSDYVEGDFVLQSDNELFQCAKSATCSTVSPETKGQSVWTSFGYCANVTYAETCSDENSSCEEGYTCDYLDSKECVLEGEQNTTCPEEFVVNTQYNLGDLVSRGTDAYECTAVGCESILSSEYNWSRLGSCVPTCPADYDSSEIYELGDQVSSDGKYYTCIARSCTSTDLSSEMYWSNDGECTQITTTTTTSTKTTTTTTTWMSKCPPEYDSSILFYENGDTVAVNTTLYECSTEQTTCSTSPTDADSEWVEIGSCATAGIEGDNCGGLHDPECDAGLTCSASSSVCVIAENGACSNEDSLCSDGQTCDFLATSRVCVDEGFQTTDCPRNTMEGMNYTAGELVTASDDSPVYECIDDVCSGSDLSSDAGWEFIGHCTLQRMDACSNEESRCGDGYTCDYLATPKRCVQEGTQVTTCPDAISSNRNYDAGELVSDGTLVYECSDDNGCDGRFIGVRGLQFVTLGLYGFEYIGHCYLQADESCDNEESLCVDGYTCDYLASKVCVEDDLKSTSCPEEYSSDLEYELGSVVSVGTEAYECTLEVGIIGNDTSPVCGELSLPISPYDEWELLGSCLLGEGANCTGAQDQCQSDLFCDATSMTCARSCVASSDCLSGEICFESACADDETAGSADVMEPCLSHDECMSGLLCYDFEIEKNSYGYCGCDPDVADSCSDGDQCISARDETYTNLYLCSCPDEWTDTPSEPYSTGDVVSYNDFKYRCVHSSYCDNVNPSADMPTTDAPIPEELEREDIWLPVDPCVVALGGEGDACTGAAGECDEDGGLTCSWTFQVCVIASGGACSDANSLCLEGDTCDYLGTKTCVLEGEEETNCPEDYVDGNTYPSGTMVTVDEVVYECVGDCPSTSLPTQDSINWILLGPCSSSTPCPAEFDKNTLYEMGDVVAAGTTLYTCKLEDGCRLGPESGIGWEPQEGSCTTTTTTTSTTTTTTTSSSTEPCQSNSECVSSYVSLCYDFDAVNSIDGVCGCDESSNNCPTGNCISADYDSYPNLYLCECPDEYSALQEDGTNVQTYRNGDVVSFANTIYQCNASRGGCTNEPSNESSVWISMGACVSVTVQGAEGDACGGENDPDCDDGLTCSNSVCTLSEEGDPSPVASASCGGTSCSAGEICVDDTCATMCSDNESCASGETCVTECDAGATCGYCSEDSSPVLSNAGGSSAVSCTQTTDCPTGNVCVDNVCSESAYGAEGDTCGGENDPDCDDGLTCSNSVCTLSEEGDPSPVASAACGGTTCSAGEICVDDVCKTECNDNESCDSGEECLSGYCIESFETGLGGTVEVGIGDTGDKGVIIVDSGSDGTASAEPFD